MFVAINYIVDRLREYVDAIGLSQSDPARCRIENLFRYVNDNLLQGGRFYTKKTYEEKQLMSFFAPYGPNYDCEHVAFADLSGNNPKDYSL
ncbi:MAG: hypothetical protein LRY69_05510 [Gammaproteobacteria bacterium]|nr:hypothetical protein [Gammaproteobacteria bacterium]